MGNQILPIFQEKMAIFLRTVSSFILFYYVGKQMYLSNFANDRKRVIFPLPYWWLWDRDLSQNILLPYLPKYLITLDTICNNNHLNQKYIFFLSTFPHKTRGKYIVFSIIRCYLNIYYYFVCHNVLN